MNTPPEEEFRLPETDDPAVNAAIIMVANFDEKHEILLNKDKTISQSTATYAKESGGLGYVTLWMMRQATRDRQQRCRWGSGNKQAVIETLRKNVNQSGQIEKPAEFDSRLKDVYVMAEKVSGMISAGTQRAHNIDKRGALRGRGGQ
ncbi:hypothetical protein EG329_008493 [Mollisiaceae sp. DMI_Dod_QoI]|nr:hypothetical protein EG329_008493 [Helotiales sp. DMI_Dod_QoI]